MLSNAHYMSLLPLIQSLPNSARYSLYGVFIQKLIGRKRVVNIVSPFFFFFFFTVQVGSSVSMKPKFGFITLSTLHIVRGARGRGGGIAERTESRRHETKEDVWRLSKINSSYT